VEREGKKYEEFAYILDYLPQGRLGSQKPAFRGEGLVQMVGGTYFTLLEAIPRRGETLQIGDMVYVGMKGRTQISHIIGRINYDDLTSTAKAELPAIIETMIKGQEQRFLKFFNESQPITSRMHAMELIPGIGKKLMWQVLNQREIKKFTSFEDLKERANIQDPVKMLAKRIIDELSKEEKYRLFTRPS
jgi:putative nucleotide binding protein